MKLRNILMVVATMGIMFSSMDRTDVVGYTAGDYTDMNYFPHKAAGQNVAYTSGTNFAAVWSDGGSTWGFTGGDTDDLVNMMWSNGTYGVQAALSMDSAVDGETTFDLGFGMNLMGYDVGFFMDTAEDGPMGLNLRGNCNFWVWDTMTFSYDSDNTSGTDWTEIDVNLYSVNEWGPATGMFAMGFTSSDDPAWQDDGDLWAEPVTLINTSFSVESTLTDWCDLRIGYNKSFNMSAADGESVSTDSYHAGLGFNYGSVALDMIITDATLDAMVSNPLQYVNGRNASPLAASWTLSYTW
jgi:hypothetical protein